MEETSSGCCKPWSRDGTLSMREVNAHGLCFGVVLAKQVWVNSDISFGG